jgi:hypothetical protein
MVGGCPRELNATELGQGVEELRFKLMFRESVSCRVVGGCPRELNATKLGQGVEELRFKLTSLVGGDGL